MSTILLPNQIKALCSMFKLKKKNKVQKTSPGRAFIKKNVTEKKHNAVSKIIRQEQKKKDLHTKT